MYFPRQPGTFERVIKGIDTVLGVGLNIANAVKSWQTQGSMQEARELEGIANRVKIGQSLAEMSGQAVPATGIAGAAKKAGIEWPTITPERQVEAQDTAIRAGGPVPGGTERIGQERGRGIAEQVAASMPIGGPAPFMPKTKKIALVGTRGEVSTKDIGPGISEVIKLGKEGSENWIFDREGNPIANLGNVKPYWQPKPEKTAADYEEEAAAKARGREAGSSGVKEIDPDTGLTVKTHKRRPFYSKTDTSQVPIITEDQAENIALEGGKVPKGAKILKKSDPEYKIYNQARNEATRRILGDTKLGMKVGPEQEKAINEMADTIYQTRTSKRGGASGQTYQLPKGGQMVPVDKATYDEYWRVHGGKK